MDLTEEQSKQLKSWGVDIKSIKEEKQVVKEKKQIEWPFVLVVGIVSFVIGIIIYSLCLNAGFVSMYTTTNILENQTNQSYLYGFNDGMIYSANFTSITGNFTYIDEDRVNTMGINDYCIIFSNNLNTNGGK